MKQLSPLKDPTNPKKPLFLETTACFLQAFYIYFNKRFFKCCDQYPTKNQRHANQIASRL
ncbi:hypothetical protein JT170_03565 [Helicobacter pylori]|nr:hypothetical protein [Helicobacter pylori]